MQPQCLLKLSSAVVSLLLVELLDQKSSKALLLWGLGWVLFFVVFWVCFSVFFFNPVLLEESFYFCPV